MVDPAILLDGVTKTFRTGFRRQRVAAVSNLSLSIERGSVVAFVGPNGAGKTTTIHMLLGLLRPGAGVIQLFGEEPESTASRLRVGYMSEIFNTYPFHTARRAITFYARLSGKPIEELGPRATDLLSRVGLEKAIDRKVGTFSKGMTQRLGLAQALIHRPELLILDEPTTGLDPEGRHLVAEIIAEEQARGTTIFLSSHILSDVEESCDRVVMIREGQIILSEPLSELTARTDRWEVEVTGLSEELRAELANGGFAVGREKEEIAIFDCTSGQKKELLRKLIDSPAEIGTIQNKGRSLSDLYMKHVGNSEGEVFKDDA